MRIAAALVPLLLVSTAAAADHTGTTPLLGYAGGTYLNNDLRTAINEDWGGAVGFAALLAESGAIGMPSADIDLRYVPGAEATLVAVGTAYAERALISDRAWFGLGIGANWIRLEIEPEDTTQPSQEERRWRIAGKAMLGYLLTDRLFVEASYHRSGKVLGIDTSSTTFAIGYWF